METSWDQLTHILTPENREDLANALLEVLSTDQWLQTEIITKGHYMDRIFIRKCIHLRHSKNRKIITSKI